MSILSPGGSIIQKNTYLPNNAGINRFPTSQVEWNTFVQELNRWMINEEGSFTPTFNGFSADPATPIVNYVRMGPIVNVRFAFNTGTSDDTVFEITNWPEALQPDTAQIVWFFGGYDNGSDSSAPVAALFAASSTLKFGLDIGNELGGGWTGGGTVKGFQNANFSLTYNLWSKGMSRP